MALLGRDGEALRSNTGAESNHFILAKEWEYGLTALNIISSAIRATDPDRYHQNSARYSKSAEVVFRNTVRDIVKLIRTKIVDRQKKASGG